MFGSDCSTMVRRTRSPVWSATIAVRAPGQGRHARNVPAERIVVSTGRVRQVCQKDAETVPGSTSSRPSARPPARLNVFQCCLSATRRAPLVG